MGALVLGRSGLPPRRRIVFTIAEATAFSGSVGTLARLSPTAAACSFAVRAAKTVSRCASALAATHARYRESDAAPGLINRRSARRVLENAPPLLRCRRSTAACAETH